MSARTLVAEDNRRQADVIERYLRSEGHQVQVVHDGQEALRQARRQPPDLLVLDVMMPGMDGLNVCRLLRRESSVLILMLTARSDEDDLLLGLDSGADDYLVKPFRPKELLARRTLLRRADRVRTTDKVLHVGGLSVDLEQCTVMVEDRPVDCTPAEFAILAVLADRPDRPGRYLRLGRRPRRPAGRHRRGAVRIAPGRCDPAGRRCLRPTAERPGLGDGRGRPGRPTRTLPHRRRRSTGRRPCIPSCPMSPTQPRSAGSGPGGQATPHGARYDPASPGEPQLELFTTSTIELPAGGAPSTDPSSPPVSVRGPHTRCPACPSGTAA